MIKTAFLRVAAFVISSIFILFAGVGSSEEYDVRDPENLKLNFSVISDSHIESNNKTRYEVFAKALENVSKNKSGNDAVIFLGDNTMNGQFIESLIFHGTVRQLLKDEKILPAVGNHDIGNGQGDYEKLQNRWYDFSEAFFGRDEGTPYYYEIIDGCFFIVLGTEAQ